MRQSMRRVGWGVADQAASSVTNFVVLVVAAAAVHRASFGAFAITLATGAIALGVARAVAAEPLSVRLASTAAADRAHTLGGALGAALFVGIVAATVVAAVGLGVGGATGRAFLPLAVVLPGLTLQDASRFALVADGRAAAAFASDLCWLIGQAVVLVAIAPFGSDSGPAIVLAWGATAHIGLLVPFTLGLRPQLRRARSWLRSQRDLWPRFLGEMLALTGAWQLALLGLGIVAGLDSVGAVRAAQVLLGPLNVVFLAVPLVLVPESSRWWRHGHGEPPRHAAWIGATLAALALAWGSLVLLLPGDVGRSLLGASWTTARPLVVPLSVVMAAVGVTLGALTGLRVLGAVRRSLHARITTSSAVVIAIVLGGALFGATGASWGWAVAAGAGAVVWRHALSHAWRDAPRTPPARLAVAP